MELIDGLKANTSKGTSGVILSMLEGRPKGRVLDAPAGAGAISRLLAKRGHDVIAFEINEREFAAKEVSLVTGDMNRPLPFRNESFAYVVCMDGIEHLENPYFAIREFARILKPGGELFISTPNISAFRSRARYFLRASTTKGKHRFRSETLHLSIILIFDDLPGNPLLFALFWPENKCDYYESSKIGSITISTSISVCCNFYLICIST